MCGGKREGKRKETSDRQPAASGLAGCACLGGLIRQRAAFGHLQLVVLGKVYDEVPGHGFSVAQVGVHDDDLDAVHDGGHAPRGIRDVTAQGGLGAAGAELAHDTGQALGPVAGAKGAATPSDALDEHLLGGGCDGHGRCAAAVVLRSVPRVEGGGCCCGLPTPPGEAAFQMLVLYLI